MASRRQQQQQQQSAAIGVPSSSSNSNSSSSSSSSRGSLATLFGSDMRATHPPSSSSSSAFNSPSHSLLSKSPPGSAPPLTRRGHHRPRSQSIALAIVPPRSSGPTSPAPSPMKQKQGKQHPPPHSANPATKGENFQLEISFGTHEMQGRRKTMEDAHTAIPLPEDKEEAVPSESTEENGGPRIAFFGVFDGHGGQKAADYVAQHLYHNIRNAPQFGSGDYLEAVGVGFSQTEEEFIKIAAREMIEDGSTAIIALIVDHTLIVANVGDSEGVLCRDGGYQVLSVPHNPKKNESEMQRILAAGGKLYNRRVAHPTINPTLCSLAVSRAFGDIIFKDPDYTDNKPSGIIAEPFIMSTELTKKDAFLILACDGLWDVMNAEEAVNFVKDHISKNMSIQDIAEELTLWAYRNGSNDNITVQIIQFKYTTEGAEQGQGDLTSDSSSSSVLAPNSVSQVFDEELAEADSSHLNEILQLKADLQRAEVEITAYRGKLQKATVRISDLESEIERLKDELNALRKRQTL